MTTNLIPLIESGALRAASDDAPEAIVADCLDLCRDELGLRLSATGDGVTQAFPLDGGVLSGDDLVALVGGRRLDPGEYSINRLVHYITIFVPPPKGASVVAMVTRGGP